MTPTGRFWVTPEAIGTGAAICNAFLKQRDYDDHMPIQECLYRILESKMAAEKDPYVGKATALEVLTLETDYTLSGEYIKAIMVTAMRPILTNRFIRLDYLQL